MKRHMHLFLSLWLSSCTPVARDNMYDPGAGTNYRPHFRYVTTVSSYPNLSSFWVGASAIYLRSALGSGTNTLTRLGFDGAVQRETNAQLPEGGSSPLLQGWDGNGGTTLVLTTNNAFVYLDRDFNVLSNDAGLSTNGPLDGFFLLPGTALEAISYNSAPGMLRLFRPGFFALTNFPAYVNSEAYFSIQMNDAGTVPTAFLLSGKTMTGMNDAYCLCTYHPTTGALLGSNIYRTSTNLNGMEVKSMAEARGYKGGYLFRGQVTGGHQYVRVSSGGAWEIQVLDPEPAQATFNAGSTTYGASSSGYLVLRNNSTLLVYKATGN